MSIKFLRLRADKLRALRSRFMHYGKMARSVMGNKLNTALIILLLATAPALALSPDAPPPPKYDHPFNGVVRVDHDVAACIKMRPLVPGEIRLGCTDWRKTADAKGLCVVHMLPDKELKRKELKRYGFSRERLLRHHIGHCNGWPDDHSIPSSEPPPAKYDHPFDGVLRVDRDMHDCDEDMGPKKARLACTTGRVAYYDAEKIDDTKSLCIIHMLPDEELRARGFTSEMILRHEVGHCNGWPEDHPME
jgi:hypothetical protein